MTLSGKLMVLGALFVVATSTGVAFAGGKVEQAPQND